jgi:hypothetical protein
MLNTLEEIFGNTPDIRDMVYQTMAINNAIDYLEWAIENNKIDKQIGERLIEMLRSPDKENANLAILALEQMTNEHNI